MVEIGKPVMVARITVAPAPNATAATKYADASAASGTRPLPENAVSSDSASAIAASEPANVVAVAQAIAVR